MTGILVDCVQMKHNLSQRYWRQIWHYYLLQWIFSSQDGEGACSRAKLWIEVEHKRFQ